MGATQTGIDGRPWVVRAVPNDAFKSEWWPYDPVQRQPLSLPKLPKPVKEAKAKKPKEAKAKMPKPSEVEMAGGSAGVDGPGGPPRPHPPPGWAFPTEGQNIEVDVSHDMFSGWCTATVCMVLIDGWFKAKIQLPDRSDEWDDWFHWHEEGKDWRRFGLQAEAAAAEAEAAAAEARAAELAAAVAAKKAQAAKAAAGVAATAAPDPFAPDTSGDESEEDQPLAARLPVLNAAKPNKGGQKAVSTRVDAEEEEDRLVSEDDDDVEDEDGPALAAVPRPPPAAKSPPKPKVEKKAKAKSEAEEKDHFCDKCGQRFESGGALGGHRKHCNKASASRPPEPPAIVEPMKRAGSKANERNPTGMLSAPNLQRQSSSVSASSPRPSPRPSSVAAPAAASPKATTVSSPSQPSPPRPPARPPELRASPMTEPWAFGKDNLGYEFVLPLHTPLVDQGMEKAMYGLRAMRATRELLLASFANESILPGGPCGLLVGLHSSIAEVVDGPRADTSRGGWELELRGPDEWKGAVKWINLTFVSNKAELEHSYLEKAWRQLQNRSITQITCGTATRQSQRLRGAIERHTGSPPAVPPPIVMPPAPPLQMPPTALPPGMPPMAMPPMAPPMQLVPPPPPMQIPPPPPSGGPPQWP